MVEKYERIRNLREDADLTQAEIGKQINVPQRTYAYYESGERMVPVVPEFVDHVDIESGIYVTPIEGMLD